MLARVLSNLVRVIEELVPDGLWERIAPLLPPPKPRRSRYPGRRPIDDRAALAGIVFVLKTGIAWSQVPRPWSAAPGSPAGDGCGTGLKPACGRPCTSCCSPSCAPPANWTWTAAPSTGPTSELSKGGPRRPVSGRPRPAGLQAPSDLRRRRDSARGDPDRRPPQRHHPADPAGRRRAAD